MLLKTPFHDRVEALNQTQLWNHWAGHLVVDKYQMSEKFEYFAIRNSAGFFDTSPLYKYRFSGRDARPSTRSGVTIGVSFSKTA
jgi:aminomethyltransferase